MIMDSSTPCVHAMNKIKTGLVGYGFAGSTFHAPVLSAIEALELAAVASSKPELVHKDWPQATVYADAAQLFADPAIELVVIAAPMKRISAWRWQPCRQASTWWSTSPSPFPALKRRP
jgi:hypothetical protein